MLFSNQLDTKMLSYLGTQLELSLVSFFWNVLLFNYCRRDRIFFTKKTDCLQSE